MEQTRDKDDRAPWDGSIRRGAESRSAGEPSRHGTALAHVGALRFGRGAPVTSPRPGPTVSPGREGPAVLNAIRAPAVLTGSQPRRAR